MKRKMITEIATAAIILGFSAINASAWGWGNGGCLQHPPPITNKPTSNR